MVSLQDYRNTMKILALEKETARVDWSLHSETLKLEAEHVYKLYLDGVIREIYFNEKKNAVLLMECESIDRAESIIKSFPLVTNGLIRFEIMSLHPYTGLSRLMSML